MRPALSGRCSGLVIGMRIGRIVAPAAADGLVQSTIFEPIFFQKLLNKVKCFFFVFLSLIKTHHLFSNISCLPFSGPLTSEPAIGCPWVQIIPFFKKFFIIFDVSIFEEPISVIIFLLDKDLFILRIKFLYSLIGVLKIIKSDFFIA